MRACSSAEGVVVASVRRRSAAAGAGLAAGDRLLAVNGHPLRDAIDFQFYSAEDVFEVEVERAAVRTAHTVMRTAGDLGLELEPPRAGEIATCANKCVFCFIHQLPKGMRRSLYVKDDDFRLSFLHGNYITLSDLSEEAFARIIAQRLSPLYVSVHTTDPALRHALLGRPRHSAEILPRLEHLSRAGIRLHAQIVLCPDWNDGVHLERTVFELAPLSPQVVTTAIVPVGLTRHRERLPSLRRLRDEEARALVSTVTRWQERLHAALGTRFVFLADEVYLQAGVEVPAAVEYEGFPVAEDGVGLVRRFEDEFRRARPPAKRPSALVTVVTGLMYASRLDRLLTGLGGQGVGARVVGIPNDFFGRDIAVAGLLTGADIRRHLAAQAQLGAAVLVPSVAVRDGENVFLDDLTPRDLARDLGVPVRIVEPTARALWRALRAT